MKVITQHTKKAAIDSMIIYLKISNQGFRAISSILLKEFDIKISHTSVQKYYMSALNGEAIEEGIKNSRGSLAGAQAGEECEAGEELPFDQSVYERTYEELTDNWKFNDLSAEFANLYAQTIALVSANMAQHRRGEARLKTEYIKYIKEMRGLYHRPLTEK